MTIRRLFIACNNRVTLWRCPRVTPRQLLLLAPHCLQRRGCASRVTDDIEHCARCGQCAVSDLLGLCREYGIPGHLVGGGRRAIEKVRHPDVRAVVAVACEQELCQGIVAAFPKPVLAVSNRLPNGPCLETSVDVASVRRAIETLIGRGQPDKPLS